MDENEFNEAWTSHWAGVKKDISSLNEMLDDVKEQMDLLDRRYRMLIEHPEMQTFERLRELDADQKHINLQQQAIQRALNAACDKARQS